RTIFEPFTQGHPRQSSGGLGIRLSLVRRIVDLHGGSIEVGDAPDGPGSEFPVRLRLTAEPLPGGGGPAAPRAGRRPPGAPRPRRRDAAGSYSSRTTTTGASPSRWPCARPVTRWRPPPPA